VAAPAAVAAVAGEVDASGAPHSMVVPGQPQVPLARQTSGLWQLLPPQSSWMPQPLSTLPQVRPAQVTVGTLASAPGGWNRSVVFYVRIPAEEVSHQMPQQPRTW
jgi:hypothetical protein